MGARAGWWMRWSRICPSSLVSPSRTRWAISQWRPNPLLVENRAATADRVVAEQADLGIAWDGDFDRCFFFDNAGHFIEGYYIVGLLAEAFLSQLGPQRIVHDPRLTWNTQDIARIGGGEPVLSKTGHAFIKERMREVDAVYGSEMSAHHYFRSSPTATAA